MIKLLVIDDEPGVCDVIQKTFTYIGFSVSGATTAERALRLMERERPGIVFLDISMPDMDGIDLLKQIKHKYPDVIVIMVTARQDKAARQQAEDAGADEFITKPFSRNYLRDVVVQKIKDVLDKGGHMQQPHILLVDDERDFRATVKDYIINRFECDLDEAADGRTAIEKVRALQPDVVLLDIKMPGINGIEAIGEIRKINPHARIIIISAWKSAEVVNKAVRVGASDYIAKPVSLPVLNEKLRAALISIGKLKMKKIEQGS